MKLVWSVMVAAMASSVVGAQSTKPMNEHEMGDNTMTYTGCVESINHGAAFMLTHIAQDSMGNMHHDMSMKSSDAMMKKNDEMMKKDEQKMDASMDGHAMAPSAFKLTGFSNVKNQVGKKVSVTGTVAKDSTATRSNDPDTLTVRSLKVIAKSCS